MRGSILQIVHVVNNGFQIGAEIAIGDKLVIEQSAAHGKAPGMDVFHHMYPDAKVTPKYTDEFEAMNMLMNNDCRIFAVLSSFYIFSYV